MDNRYIEIAEGHVGNRGVVIPLDSLIEHVREEKDKMELYSSYYTFDNELVEHFKVFKTIKGFKGKYYLDRILFDIDKGVNTKKQLLENVRFFIDEELKNNWDLPEEWIRVWFSGNGYHVVIPDIFGFEPSRTLPQVVKKTLTHHFPIGDSIYDGSRIIRVGYSYNSKSGLFKIPLSLKEIFNLSCEEIEEIALHQRTDYYAEKLESIEPYLQNMILQPSEGKQMPKKGTVAQDDPSSIVTCVQKIYAEGPVQGSRHKKLLRMASSFRRDGVPQSGIVNMLQNWADTIEPYEVKRLVNGVFEHGYRYGCNDEVMSEYCDPKCVYYKRKDYTLEIVNSDQMEKNFTKFIRSDYLRNSFDMFRMFSDNSEECWVFPGELVVVTADTGIGKTAFVQNIVTKVDVPVLFLSLETHETLMFRRFIQITTSKTKEEVMEYYKKNENTLSNSIRHIQIMSISPELSAIKQIVAEVQPKILVVDTTDMIEVPYAKSLEKDDKIVKELKQLAINQNIIVIGIHHISKGASREDHLSVHSLKGSSAIEQKADKVVGIETPGGVAAEKTRVRFITVLKARDEGKPEMKLDYNHENFRFESPDNAF